MAQRGHRRSDPSPQAPHAPPRLPTHAGYSDCDPDLCGNQWPDVLWAKFFELWRRIAISMDEVFKGAKPGTSRSSKPCNLNLSSIRRRPKRCSNDHAFSYCQTGSFQERVQFRGWHTAYGCRDDYVCSSPHTYFASMEAAAEDVSNARSNYAADLPSLLGMVRANIADGRV
jgi:hypothetical protein